MKLLILPCILVLLLSVSTALASVCSIDAFGLTVSADGRISANIKNLGDSAETVFYTFYVNGAPASGNPQIRLNPSETKTVSAAYPFSDGTFDVGISVVAACGSSDTETIKHTVLQKYACRNPLGQEGQDYCNLGARSYYTCVNGRWELRSIGGDEYCRQCNTCGDGILNCGETAQSCPQDAPKQQVCQEKILPVFRCSGNVRQREYQNADCTKTWTSLEYCPYGCSEGVCMPFAPAVEKPSEPADECGVKIENIGYADSVYTFETNYITIELLNTVSRIETIDLLLYLDGSVYKRLSISAAPNAAVSPRFAYSFAEEGGHRLTVEVTAKSGSCSSKEDSMTVRVYAYERETQVSVAIAEMPAAVQPKTEVSIHPIEIDVPVYGGSVVTVDIKTDIPQDFSISVVSVPYDWAAYQSKVHVEKEGTAYIYFTPKSAGKSSALIIVSGGGKTFTQRIDIFAAKRGEGMENLVQQVFATVSQPPIVQQYYIRSVALNAPLYSIYETVSYLLIALLFVIIPLSVFNFGIRKRKNEELGLEI